MIFGTLQKVTRHSPVICRTFCKLSAYDVKAGMVIFREGRYAEILSAVPSTNKKLGSNTYKLETLDLFTSQTTKEYVSYGQIGKFDVVDTAFLNVEFQYCDEEKNVLVMSDEVYTQHEVPSYLFRGHIPSLQPGSRFTVMMDGERYIRLI